MKNIPSTLLLSASLVFTPSVLAYADEVSSISKKIVCNNDQDLAQRWQGKNIQKGCYGDGKLEENISKTIVDVSSQLTSPRCITTPLVEPVGSTSLTTSIIVTCYGEKQ